MYSWIVICLSLAMVAGGLIWRAGGLARRGAAGTDLSVRAGGVVLKSTAGKSAGGEAAGGLALKSAGDEAAHESACKKDKRRKLFAGVLAIIGAYVFLIQLLGLVFGPRESAELHFSLWPSRVDVFGFSLSTTVVYTWLCMALLVAGALILRVAVVNKFGKFPKGAQNAIELIVESAVKYKDDKARGTGEFLSSYVLSVAALLICSAFIELFRIRPPAADISLTFALALLTFVLINVYGIKRKGPVGRIKSLASPTPVVFVFRIVSELAIPVSMACRLFGNMLGGFIVIDLLLIALGRGAIGVPSVVGLYFNVFHPLIQTFIFVTLTLTFINEAIE